MPIGRKETRPAFSFCPFSHSRDYRFLPGLVPPEKGLVLGEPKWLLQLKVPLFQPQGQGAGAKVSPGAHSCLSCSVAAWLPGSQGLTLKKQALPSRCLRALGLCREVFNLTPWGQGEGKDSADPLLSPSALSCL